MCPCFHDLAVFDDEDDIGMLNRAPGSDVSFMFRRLR